MVAAAAFPGMTGGDAAIALVEGEKAYSYRELDERARRFAAGLLAGRHDLGEERVGSLLPASLDYVTALHGTWRAGGIAVPLAVAAAEAELAYYLGNAGITRLLTSPELRDRLRPVCDRLAIELLTVDDVLAAESRTLPEVPAGRRAMILFTSGTTSKPKGVVITHDAIHAQIKTLVEAWEWRATDVIPLFLPLHHIHGIINVLNCALWSGATVHLMPQLDIPRLCAQVAAGTFTVFMAVPTVYVKLVDYLDGLGSAEAKSIRDGFGRMRLNVSGSAACPVTLFETWRELTGQVLLERYGMTEIGMAISNPYRGERRAGFVGQPLPGVSVQLFDEQDAPITKEDAAGEIRIRGRNVFREYWQNPAASAESFRDGWFCTGDIAVVEGGYFRIMGRSSIDIIKSGGYKLSALEIEGVLLTHPDIAEAAVIGVEDETWGEAVAAIVSLRNHASLEYPDLKQWCSEKMSAYKIPKIVKVVDALPRNAMGKVTKPELKSLL